MEDQERAQVLKEEMPALYHLTAELLMSVISPIFNMREGIVDLCHVFIRIF